MPLDQDVVIVLPKSSDERESEHSHQVMNDLVSPANLDGKCGYDEIQVGKQDTTWLPPAEFPPGYAELPKNSSKRKSEFIHEETADLVPFSTPSADLIISSSACDSNHDYDEASLVKQGVLQLPDELPAASIESPSELGQECSEQDIVSIVSSSTTNANSTSFHPDPESNRGHGEIIVDQNPWLPPSENNLMCEERYDVSCGQESGCMPQVVVLSPSTASPNKDSNNDGQDENLRDFDIPQVPSGRSPGSDEFNDRHSQHNHEGLEQNDGMSQACSPEGQNLSIPAANSPDPLYDANRKLKNTEELVSHHTDTIIQHADDAIQTLSALDAIDVGQTEEARTRFIPVICEQEVERNQVSPKREGCLSSAPKASLQERVVSKQWKERTLAYEELAQAIIASPAADIDSFVEYCQLLPSIAADTNACAKTKGLAACLALVNKLSISFDQATTLSKILVSDSFKGNTRTQSDAQSVMLQLIERGHITPVIDAVLDGADSKIAKVACASIQCIISAVEEFGLTSLPAHIIETRICGMLSHQSDAARSLAVKLCGVMYSLRGVSFQDCIARMQLKSSQEKELQSLFGSTIVQQSHPKRQILLADGSVPAKTQMKMPFSTSSDERDIFARIPENWLSEMKSVHWKERKAAIEFLVGITSKVQIKWVPEVADILDAVIAQLSDTNIMILAQAISALSNFADGLASSKFVSFALLAFPLIVSALKEKKPHVSAPALAFLNVFVEKVVQLDLSLVLDDIVAALNHKVPKIISDILLWLSEVLPKCYSCASRKGFAETLGPAIASNLEHSSADVRGNALSAIAALSAVVGDKNPFILKFFHGFEQRDPARFKKILSVAAEISAIVPEPKLSVQVFKEKKGFLAIKQDISPNTAEDGQPRSSSIPKAVVKNLSAAKAPCSSRSASLSVPKDRQGGISSDASPTQVRAVSSDAVNETVLPPLAFEDAKLAFIQFFPESIMDDLASKQWKDRLSAVSTINERLDAKSATELCMPVMYVFHKTPGWKEVNIQVASLMFEIVSKLASTSICFSSKLAGLPLVAALTKLGDAKVAPSARDYIIACCEALGPETVIPMVLSRAETIKNPKALQGIATTIGSAARDFGAGTIPIKLTVAACKSWLGHAVVGVRNDATAALVEIYKQAGSPAMLNAILDGLKPSLAKTLEAELRTITPGEPIIPTRFKRGQQSVGPVSAAKTGDNLIDRVDISSKITSKILKQMESEAWKDRKEALDAVTRILDEARHAIQPNIKNLLKAVLVRANDANKLLVLTALSVVRTLGDDIGPSAVHKHAKAVVPVVMMLAADSKKHIAAEARGAILAWIRENGLHAALPSISKTLESHPILREGVLEVLLQRFADEIPDTSVAQPLLHATFSCLQDKVVAVRFASEKLAALFVASLGSAFVRAEALSLSRTAQLTVLPVIDKVQDKGNSNEGSTNRNDPIPVILSSTRRATQKSSIPVVNPSQVQKAPSGVPPRRTLSRTLRKRKPFEGAKRVLKRSKSVEPAPVAKSDSGDDPCDLRLSDYKSICSRRESRWRQGQIGFQEWSTADIFHLNELLVPYTSSALHMAMFSDDFQKHVSAIDTIELSTRSSVETVKSLCDLLLMWSSFRIAEDKTQVVVKAIALCTTIISSCPSIDEYDANCFMPVVVEKLLGHNKQPLRFRGRDVLKISCNVWSPSLVGRFLFDGIMTSKNSRVKSACMDELCQMAGNHPFDSCVPKKTLQTVAEYVTNHDSSIRNAAIALLQKGFADLGDSTFWSRLGTDISERSRSAIDKLLKKGAASPRVAPVSRSRSRTVDPITSAAASQLLSDPMNETSIAAINRTGNGIFSKNPLTSTLIAYIDQDMFQLDLTDIDSHTQTKVLESNLSEHLSKTLPAGIGREIFSPLLGDTEPSNSSKIETVIQQLHYGNADMRLTTTKALFEYVEKCGGNDEVLVARANDIIASLLSLFRDALDQDPPHHSLLRRTVQTLMELIKCHRLTSELTVDTLQTFYQSVMPLMTDSFLTIFPDIKNDRFSVNVLLLKSLEMAERSRCYSALIRCLTDHWSKFADDKSKIPLSGLFCRCIVKMIRTLDVTHQRLNVSVILDEVHCFLERYPQSFWQTRGVLLGESKPWNVIYTLVMKLLDFRGRSLLQELPVAAQSPGSILHEIIHEKLVLSATPSQLATQLSKTSKSKAPDDPKLTDIIRRVQISEFSQDALLELNRFRLSHPFVDIESYLANLNDDVRQYINRNLSPITNMIGAEGPAAFPQKVTSFQARLKKLQTRATSADPPLGTRTLVSGTAMPSAPVESVSSMNSLNRLRQRLQLAHFAADSKENEQVIPNTDPHIGKAEGQTIDESDIRNAASLDAIRARIAKLRGSSSLH